MKKPLAQNPIHSTSLIFAATVFAQFAVSSAQAACGANPSENYDPAATEALVRQIEEKFGLKAEQVSYRCGGGAIEFRYHPPIKIVPDDSEYFTSWNESFPLGSVTAGEQDPNSSLRSLLDHSVEKVEALKLAQSLLLRDHLRVEAEFGLEVYIWPKNFTESGSLLDVSAPSCKGESYYSAFSLGQISAPIFNLQGLLASPRAPLYQEGQLYDAIAQSTEVVQALDQLSRENLANEKYVKEKYGRFGLVSHCSRHRVQAEKVPLSWNKTRARFGLEPISE